MAADVMMRPATHRSVGSSKSRPSSRPSIEYYMRPESRMSSSVIPKIAQEEGEKRSHYAWRLIRFCVREAVDLSLKADIDKLDVHHGVHHFKKLFHAKPILQMLYKKNCGEYITIDGELIRVFHPDGRKKELIKPAVPFDKLIYAQQSNLYVGWLHRSSTLLLMNPEFQVVSTSEVPGLIDRGIYNETLEEVITVGEGHFTTWVFRYGGRHILPRRSFSGILPNVNITAVALEGTISRTQRCFMAHKQSVTVVSVAEGTIVSQKAEMHSRDITCLLFVNPLKYLVSAAKDGCIKIWDDNWHIQLVFVGHCGEVTALSMYPYGPTIMSASTDNTIRIWSLEASDEMDSIQTEKPLLELGSTLNNNKFFSVSSSHADLWSINNLHLLHSRIGYPAQLLQMTDHPEFPPRAMIQSKDSSVRIMNPASGDIMTTLLMPPNRKLVDSAYAVAENNIYACFSNGEMIKACTKTNPCKILAEWPADEDPKKACNYLLVYEYCITADMDSTSEADMWKALTRAGKQKKGQESPSDNSRSSSMASSVAQRNAKKQAQAAYMSSKNANRTLLLGGRKDGYICVFNKETGKVYFQVEAHGEEGVLSMIANSKQDQLISAGNDNIIKVWRLFPYAQEALSLLMTLFCAHTPVYMAMGKNNLAVAFQEHSSATYSIVMYHLGSKRRIDHSPSDDHSGSFVGLTSCPKLKLIASASIDGTVRLYNEDNILIRIIHLKDIPNSLTFCSEKGSLLVGLGDNIHKIDYKNYLPAAYRFKMISLKLKDEVTEPVLEYSKDLVDKFSREDQKRLKNARASFKFTHFMDILTPDETDEVMKERFQKQKAFDAIAAREDELLQLISGELAPKQKRMPTMDTKREGFKKYLDLFYNRPKKKKPKDEDYYKGKLKEFVHGPPPPKKVVWYPDKEPTGFFERPVSKQEPEPKPAKRFLKASDDAAKLASSKSPRAPSPVSRPTSPASPSKPKATVEANLIRDILSATQKPSKKSATSARARSPGRAQAAAGPPTSAAPKTAPGPLTPATPKVAAGLLTPAIPATPASRLGPSSPAKSQERGKSFISLPRQRTQGMMSKERTLLSTPGTPIRADGYIPNSIIVKLLFHDEPPQEKVEEEPYKPPQLTEEQLAQIKEHFYYGDVPFHDRVIIMESDDEEGLGKRSLSLIASQADMDPNYQGDIELPDTPEDTPPATPEEDKAALEEKVAAAGTVAKKLSPQPVKKEKKMPPPPAQLPPPPKPKTPEKDVVVDDFDQLEQFQEEARKVTPPPSLPTFIKQHVGKEWFDTYFPNCNETTMPKPWTVANFVPMLCRVLRIAEFPHKLDVLAALSDLYDKEGIDDVSPIYKVLYSVLNHHTNPPSVHEPVQKEFIVQALDLMVLLQVYDEMFYMETIAQYLDGDMTIRQKSVKIWKQLGLNDPHGLFPKELESWDIWAFDESTRANDIRNMAKDFLQQWLGKFKEALENTITRIIRGEAVAGLVAVKQKSSSKKKGSNNNSSRNNTNNSGLNEQSQQLAASLGMAPPADENKVPKTVQQVLTMHISPNLDILKKVGSMDALNFFTETKFSNNLRRSGTRDKGSNLNTVLVLPKIPGKGTLVRLGETHTSACHPLQETTMETRNTLLPPLTNRGYVPQPGDLTGFPNAISLPMKPITMNPFPSPLDILDPLYTSVQPVMIMLRMPQKYFLIDRSYPSVPAS